MIHVLAQLALPSFAVPSLAVAGAVAISIPIIIHILSRRPRKPQPWAAMRFLLAAYRKHRVRTRLEQLLLLLVRCLILFLLGLAL
ncbi:MAG: BatA domain-containing protein, partial [Phycisphaerae bacterium]|nr:BatA domain-containing protein [Phycisphaerae bacterium]